MYDSNTKIALTNLGKYNEGELCYVWLTLPYTDDEFEKAKEEIGIDDEEYEEYFISDYETDLEGLKIGEYENLEELNDLISEIEDLKDWEIEELEAVMEATGEKLNDAIDTWRGGDFVYYSGVKSLEDLAEQMVDEGLYGEIPKAIEYYIDYEKIARDLRGSGAFTETSNGVIEIF